MVVCFGNQGNVANFNVCKNPAGIFFIRLYYSLISAMAFKIVVTGDLHLGRSSGSVQGNPEEISTRFTWERIVNWCIENRADLLFLTGDIVDRNNRYFEAVGPLQKGFDKLEEASIPVFMVAGNHDFDVLKHISESSDHNNVRLLGGSGEWELVKFEKEGHLLQVAGWSFPRQYVVANPLSLFSKDAIDPNYPSVGLLHCDLSAGSSRYNPVEPSSLMDIPVDAWILGHIHKPRVVKESNPLILYPGSPHALSAKENGIHGPFLLTVEGGNNIKYEQLPLSPVRFETIRVDITGAEDEEDVRSRLIRAVDSDANAMVIEQEGIVWLVYDIHLVGEYRVPVETINRAVSGTEDFVGDIGNGTRILIRKLESLADPVLEDLGKLAGESSPAGKLAETIIALREGRRTPFIESLLAEWNIRQQSLINSAVYRHLRSSHYDPGNGDEGPGVILRECQRLLGELVSQQSTIKQ